MTGRLLAAALALWTCCAAVSAAAQTLGPQAQRFADCTYVRDARALDALKRVGIAARVCTIAPGLRFAIMADDTVSWPQLQRGDAPWASLEDTIAAKAWFAETAPLRVRFDTDSFAVLREPAGAPRALVYSAAVSRTLGGPSITAYVALRLAPFCALAVTDDAAAALRAAGDAGARCLAKVR